MKNIYTTTISNNDFSHNFPNQEEVNYQETTGSNSVKYEIQIFESVKKPNVMKLISIDEAFKMIKHGIEYKDAIIEARQYGKNSTEYEEIKTRNLPTFRFNFIFKEKACNANILSPTGLIYIDADNCTTITSSEYIFAKWKSLSGTGLGILVKIDNLQKSNLKDAYQLVSEKLNIESDNGARKCTQQTVLSFDEEIYVNYDSKVFKINNENKGYQKVSFSNIKKEKECIIPNDTSSYTTFNNEIRYNNISDYFYGENSSKAYIVFEENKEKICSPFIPNYIPTGARNSIMYSILSNYVALNPEISKRKLNSFASIIISKMEEELPNNEVNIMINNILEKSKKGELNKYCNLERRILFNPQINMSSDEKRKITAFQLGLIRKKITAQRIYNELENWNFSVQGKITQKTVATSLSLSIATIKRYWGEFKEYVYILNKENTLNS